MKSDLSTALRLESRPIDGLITELTAAMALDPGDRARDVAAILRPWLGRSDLLDGCACIPSSERYARKLIHADPAGRFAVLGLVWCAGQCSPVHAHRTWCAFGVHRGSLDEAYFELGRDRPGLRATVARRAGDCSHAEADPRLIHRIANAGEEPAVSVHVYGVGLDAVDHGVNRIYP